jgi:hypothetical protein
MGRGDLYRDAHVGIRARLAELEARIAAREAQVTPAFRETIEPKLREQMVATRAGTELADSDALDELAKAESMLAAYLAELDRLIDGLPAIESAWAEVPEDAPDPPPDGPLPSAFARATNEEASEVLRMFTAMVRERARDAEVAGDNPVYIARFRDRGCPFTLRATLYTQGNGQVSEVDMWLVTSIPRGLPPLVVRHESLALSIGVALGLKHDIEVGDTSFDGLFLIDGTNAAAALYLVPAVRAQLLALAHFDVPTLHVNPEGRVASLRWKFEPAPRALDAAIRVLRAVRETAPTLQFRTEVG